MKPPVACSGEDVLAAPLIAVVIPTTCDRPSLHELLESLASQIDAPQFEVVLAANRPAESSQQIVSMWSSRLSIRLEAAYDRLGAAHARNRGVRSTSAPLVVFLDDDDRASDTYLRHMAAALLVADAVASRIDVRRLNPGWRSRVRDVAQTAALGTSPAPWAYAGSLGLRREVFEAVGGFDERFAGVGGEDIDLCLRLAKAGFALTFVPDAVLHYRFRTSYREVWLQGFNYGRGGEMLEPSEVSRLGLVVSLLGPLRLIAHFDRGTRRKGAFLLARRIGAATQRRTSWNEHGPH